MSRLPLVRTCVVVVLLALVHEPSQALQHEEKGLQGPDAGALSPKDAVALKLRNVKDKVKAVMKGVPPHKTKTRATDALLPGQPGSQQGIIGGTPHTNTNTNTPPQNNHQPAAEHPGPLDPADAGRLAMIHNVAATAPNLLSQLISQLSLVNSLPHSPQIFAHMSTARGLLAAVRGSIQAALAVTAQPNPDFMELAEAEVQGPVTGPHHLPFTPTAATQNAKTKAAAALPMVVGLLPDVMHLSGVRNVADGKRKLRAVLRTIESIQAVLNTQER